MQLVGVQLDIRWEDREANCARVRSLLEAHRPEPGALVVLPEMFATGFSMNVASVAEEPHGPTERFVSTLSRELGVFVVAGVATRDDARRVTNDSITCSPDGRLISRFSKLHPFTLGGENEHYAPGDDVTTYACGEFTVAPFVCYDLRFPEAFRRAMRRQANLMTVIANWPGSRTDHRRALLVARAIENQCYVIGVNRCGKDPKLAYLGRSHIVSPTGEILADAGESECFITADAELRDVQRVRRKFPYLADARSNFLAE